MAKKDFGRGKRPRKEDSEAGEAIVFARVNVTNSKKETIDMSHVLTTPTPKIYIHFSYYFDGFADIPFHLIVLKSAPANSQKL